MNFIFGSSSKSKLDLLNQINIMPDIVVPVNINKNPLKKEKPDLYVQRIALEKCNEIIKTYKEDIVLTADTIGTRNKKILRSINTNEEAMDMLDFISGKNVDILTAFCVAKNGIIIAKKLIKTKVYFKHFNKFDIEEIIKFTDSTGVYRVYEVKGLMQSYVKKIVGSPSNIVGLPIYEIKNALVSAGIKHNIVI